MSEIGDHLRGSQARMVRILERLVMLESPTDDRAAVNAVADYLARAFGDLGATVERLAQAEVGDHLRIEWGVGEHQTLLLGHMDTVWPLGETARRPFVIEGDRATGPGAFDMKGGLVIGLFALEALQNLKLRPAQRLVFLFNSDEEIGSPTSRAHIETEARRSQAVLVLEPTREEAVVTWRKGVGRFKLEVHGRAAHSGAAHERGVSAVQELAHQVLRLEGMTDYDRGTTVNVGVVQGGTRANVRPASARAEIDLRVSTSQEGQRMTDAILGLEPVNPEARLSASGGLTRPPWESSPGGNNLFERARRVGRALGLDLWPAGAGGGSDGNFTAALGVPTLDGLGVAGNDAHAVTEWVDLASLPVRAELLAGLLLDLGK
jgi:glutamate carboxypeptidase